MSLNLLEMGPDLRDPDTPSDLDVLARCLEMVSGNGHAVEFGVGYGVSTRLIAKTLPVIAFDSFEGLPEDWRPGFPKGAFGDAEPPSIPNARIIEGQFIDTLPGYPFPEKVELIHFDADLYSSTRTALVAMDLYIQPGVILVFDEFHGFLDDEQGPVPGEQKAFYEYAKTVGLHVEVIGWGREQMAFLVVDRRGYEGGFLIGRLGKTGVKA